MSLMPTGSPRSGADASRGIFRSAPGAVEIEHDEGADVGLARGDRLGAKLDGGTRREFAGLDPARKVEG